MRQLEKEYHERRCWGMVASIDIYQCRPSYLKSAKTIARLLAELCREIKMKRYGKPLIHRFGQGDLEGISALQFIETSSITVHCDENESRAFIDIFSCRYFDHKKAERFCKNFFKAKRAKTRYYFRF